MRPNKAHINIVKTNQVAVFPQGYIHYEVNNDCKEAIFISALDHEDPGLFENIILNSCNSYITKMIGTVTISLRAFDLPDYVLENAYNLSPSEVKKMRRNNLPANPTSGTKECRERCRRNRRSETRKKRNSCRRITNSIYLAIILILLQRCFIFNIFINLIVSF